ncbi:MAG: hypothetical protein PHY64_06640 [Eubacteriales bacterium]|nr:hypothetical protein [Eubacteriales bacterium]
MRKMQAASLTFLVITVVILTAWRWFLPLPDWTVRVNGVTMILSMMLFSFSSVRLRMTK